MRQIHRVIACTGQYDCYEQREVATFVDKAVAERLAHDAQAVADAILACGTGVQDKGQNPHDLLMVIRDDTMQYVVHSSDVLDAPEADPAADLSLLGEIFDHFDFSLKTDHWNGVEVEQRCGLRAPSGETESLCGDLTEPERVPVELRTLTYRNLTFKLVLTGHLTLQRWDEAKSTFDTPVVRLEDLTDAELEEALKLGAAPERAYASITPRLTWTCEELTDYFSEGIHQVPANPQESVRQLVRLFEGWLVGSANYRRTFRADVDAALKRVGL